MYQPPTIETNLFKDYRESRVDDEAEMVLRLSAGEAD
jgi:hypothetical protein